MSEAGCSKPQGPAAFCFPSAGIAHVCHHAWLLPCRCWESHTGPLARKASPLLAEPSLWLPCDWLWKPHWINLSTAISKGSPTIEECCYQLFYPAEIMQDEGAVATNQGHTMGSTQQSHRGAGLETMSGVDGL